MIRILGVGGRKRSGKDSVCNVLVEKKGYTRLGFADNLREMCSFAFNVSMKSFLDDDLKDKQFEKLLIVNDEHLKCLSSWMKTHHIHLFNEKSLQFFENDCHVWDRFVGAKLMTPREILLLVGTAMIRNLVSASYHADVVFDIIKKHPNNFYCISDCRFLNEREAVKEYGGTTLLIESSTDDHSETHDSETGVGTAEDYDWNFFNEKKGLDVLSLDFSLFFENMIEFNREEK